MKKMSNIHTAIQNLVDKTKDMQDMRHVEHAKEATYDQIFGSSFKYLDDLCKAFPDLPPEEARRKIIGEDMDKRLRDIYLVGLALQDLIWLKEMCSEKDK